MKRRIATILLPLVAIAAALLLVETLGRRPPVAATRPAAPAAKVAVTSVAPTSLPAAPIVSYGQLLHADLRHYPVTQPWAEKVDLAYAAHIVLREPVYVCPAGEMWITRDGAQPLSQVLARAGEETEHITSEKPCYIVWTTCNKGKSNASAVCASADGFDLVSPTGRRSLVAKRDYHWDQARTWNDSGTTRLIVPTGRGVSVITLGSTIQEQYQPLLNAPPDAAFPPPLVLFDLRGILAWIPADGDPVASADVARYVNGQWHILQGDDWKQPLFHLIPMLDGSVVQIRRGQADQVSFATVALDMPAIRNDDITKLVEQLADDDPDVRSHALDHLKQYGAGIFPLLQKLQPGALPEAQARIRELLEGSLSSRLGGLRIIDQRLEPIVRLRDGGVIMRAPAGVSVPRDGQEDRVVSPDYLIIQPGHAVRELPAELAARLGEGLGLDLIGDEWIFTASQEGPMRYLPPDRLQVLLRKSEHRYRQVAAIDTRGRWILHALPSGSLDFLDQDGLADILILDPTIPDPSPRLAVWTIDIGSESGWNGGDWPVIKVRGDPSAIGPAGWELQPPETRLFTELPAAAMPAAATSPASTQPATPPLLIDPDGTRYYDGRTTLTSIRPSGAASFALPEGCTGAADQRPWLVPDNNGALLLFNDPDRIIRIRPTPAEPDPFTIEAVFASQLPPMDSIRRAWLDPAGRIDVVYGENRLAIIFPTGQIPPELSPKILEVNLRLIDPN